MKQIKISAENKPFSAPPHAFRGFAILFIVGVHSWAVPIFINANAKTDAGIKWVNTLNEVLFHDSTLFFTLISGVLFSIILQSRGWETFYKSKLLNVVLPYVLITLLYSAFVWGVDSVAFTQLELYEYLQLSLENILLGKGLFHLWYLPILALLFLLTPILVFVKDQGNLVWIFWLIVLAPLCVSRAWPDFSWMTVVYFMGAYSLGLYVGDNYQKTKTLIDHHFATFVVLTVATTITLIALFHFESSNLGWVSPKESIFYLQKLCMAALVLWLFERTITTVPFWLNVLANYAFPIYFLHGAFLYLSIILLLAIGGDSFNALQITIAGLVNLILILIFSTLIISGIKRVAGKKSRMLIGA
jgi:surface polysaccharide O-acyltransferase-like enzyme